MAVDRVIRFPVLARLVRRRTVLVVVTGLVAGPVGGLVTQVVQARPAAASPSAGTMETLTAGGNAQGGPAAAAALNTPEDAVVNGANGLAAIADTGHNQVDVEPSVAGTYFGTTMAADRIYTVAGTSTNGFSGDGGPAPAAELSGPESVAFDATGNLVVADSSNDRIRVVASTTGLHYGLDMIVGNIYTILGDGSFDDGGDGGPASAAHTIVPSEVRTDSAGDVIFTSLDAARVRVIAATTATHFHVAMTKGDVYTVAGNGGQGFSGDGGPATSAELQEPWGASADTAGDLVIADSVNNRIRFVPKTAGTYFGIAMTGGDIYTVAGNGTAGFTRTPGPALSGELNFPSSVATDSAGDLVISDSINNRMRVVAATTGTHFGISMTANDIYALTGSGSTSFGLSVQTVAVDPANQDIVIGESNEIVVLAQTTATYLGVPMVAGRLYLVAGNGTTGDTGDGASALSAEVHTYVLRVMPNGSIVFSDAADNVLRLVSNKTGTVFGQAVTTGDIYRIAGDGTENFNGDGGLASAAQLDTPWGVAADGAGDLVFADQGNHRVRMIPAASGTYYGQAMTANHIYTIAGDGSSSTESDGVLATTTGSFFPFGVTVDAGGNVLYEGGGLCLSVVTAKSGSYYGRWTNVGFSYNLNNCGVGSGTDSGDGGPATNAELASPIGIALDPNGDIALVEANGSFGSAERVRMVAVTTGTYYGIPISAGNIDTIAGDGTAGYTGDGGPATSAELSSPLDAAFDNAGDLLIADGNNVIREVITGNVPTAVPSITATPKTGLVGGTAVTVKGKAFPAADHTLTVAECTADYGDVGLNACDATNQQTVTSTAKGAFTVVMTMDAGVIAPDGSSCGGPGHTACSAVAFDTSDVAVTATVALKFKT